jgi:hypothetical protein
VCSALLSNVTFRQKLKFPNPGSVLAVYACVKYIEPYISRISVKYIQPVMFTVKYIFVKYKFLL